MSHPRGLSDEEAAAWDKLAASVEPLNPPQNGEGDQLKAGGGALRPITPRASSTARIPLHPRPAVGGPPPRNGEVRKPRRIAPGSLDSHWDKRLKSGEITPDLSLDLHDHGLDAAYTRLMRGMEQASSMGARVVLVVTGRPRPVDPADRATRRGAIRGQILDWLAASGHGENIAAIRKAHRRHGGDGALYIVLRRTR